MDKKGFQFYPGRRLPVVCRDGITRQAVRTGTGWLNTWPAAVQVYAGGKRRTVSGWITAGTFEAKGANAGLIPWTAHKPRMAKLARKLIAATAYGPLSKGLPSDHSAALADLCRTEAAGLVEPPGQQESPGWVACRLLRRLPGEDLNRLAVFFDRLARFQSAAGE